jgi:hydrogenase maturation protease
MPRTLVAGIGNIFLTDDGFGPAVVSRLAEGVDGQQVPDGVRVVDYGIRGMHLAYDLLEPWDALVMVDAVPDRGRPGAVSVLEIDATHLDACGPVDAHSLDPASVLAGLGALGGSLPARTVLVGAQVDDVGEGIGLTAAMQAAVEDAARTVLALLSHDLHRAEVS